MSEHDRITVTSLTSLELARYVLKRLVVSGDTVEKLTQDLDSDEKYLFNIVSFLEDIGWLRQEPIGEYKITWGVIHGQGKSQTA